jgi:hypothetical protein
MGKIAWIVGKLAPVHSNGPLLVVICPVWKNNIYFTVKDEEHFFFFVGMGRMRAFSKG